MPKSVKLPVNGPAKAIHFLSGVSGWGYPYASAMTGAKLVLPGPHIDAKSIVELIEEERVTFAAALAGVAGGIALRDTYGKRGDPRSGSHPDHYRLL